MTDGTIQTILAAADGSPNGEPGGTGFFSYAMNIDLKRAADGTTPLPYTPKMTTFLKPSATVFMFDMVFDPATEIVNGSPQYNSVNPCWAAAADLALDQRQMLAAIDDVAEDDGPQHAAIDGKRLLGNALDQNFIRQAIRNQFLDVTDWDGMARRKLA